MRDLNGHFGDVLADARRPIDTGNCTDAVPLPSAERWTALATQAGGRRAARPVSVAVLEDLQSLDRSILR